MTPDEPVESPALRRAQDPLVDQTNFSVERLPGLAIVFDQFAESLAEALAPLCRAASSLVVEDIESASLFDALSARLGLLAAVLYCPDLDARAVAIFDRPFVDALAHVVFGAREAQAPRRADAPDRPFTRIETQLVERASRATAQALGAGLNGFTEAAFTLERQETIADTQILGRRDMPVIATRLRFEAAGASGMVLVLVPQATLLPMRQRLSKDPAASETPIVDPRWAKQMKAGVSSALIPVSGILEELEMTLGDVSELAVGHVLNLRGAGSGRVRLESGGHNLFWCKLDQKDGRYKLEIEGPIEPEKDLLDAMLAN
jgi:flagellar motor switch protein FliM